MQIRLLDARDTIPVICTRGVNRAEISGPARKILFSARPGPARNQCIIKILLYNFFWNITGKSI